jgi:hypothetical protein
MKPGTTQHLEQYFVAEEVRPEFYRLFTSADYRPVRGFRYRVTSAGPDIWEEISAFGAAHRNAEGLITREQLNQFLSEQRTRCEIEEASI